MWNAVLNNPPLLLVNSLHHDENNFDMADYSLPCDVRCHPPNWVNNNNNNNNNKFLYSALKLNSMRFTITN